MDSLHFGQSSFKVTVFEPDEPSNTGTQSNGNKRKASDEEVDKVGLFKRVRMITRKDRPKKLKSAPDPFSKYAKVQTPFMSSRNASASQWNKDASASQQNRDRSYLKKTEKSAEDISKSDEVPNENRETLPYEYVPWGSREINDIDADGGDDRKGDVAAYHNDEIASLKTKSSNKRPRVRANEHGTAGSNSTKTSPNQNSQPAWSRKPYSYVDGFEHVADPPAEEPLTPVQHQYSLTPKNRLTKYDWRKMMQIIRDATPTRSQEMEKEMKEMEEVEKLERESAAAKRTCRLMLRGEL